ncbi:MAG TPA: NAD(P)-dependent oxidoreductase [Acidimicrobiales bacterium]|jgi:nucleoside-diphosphate-sugar epimerase|nr:NAD(P)-dependent oxidoreductase [Acidimicrobiales bacterium]
MSPDNLIDQTIVVTGVTGQVARPLAQALARGNRVVGAARFTDSVARTELEASGVECVPIDLVKGDVTGLPMDADYVLNFAVAKTNDWERDLAANSGGLAYLMEHHQRATAFLHCSSTAVYQPAGHLALDESAPLGDNHGVWPFLRTYSICKIAAEGTARWAAERFGLPTTIARLSVPYGDNGGWPAIHLHMMLSGHAIPVHVDAPSVYHPLHADDIFAMVPRLLAAAAVPAVTVNWGGSEPVSIEEWCTYLGELAGVEASFDPTTQTIDSVQIDTTRMHELAGRTTVPWRDGMRRMARILHPDKVA